MKKTIVSLLALSVAATANVRAGEEKTIRISTAHTDLVLNVASDGHLYQGYYGERLANDVDAEQLAAFLPAAGNGTPRQRGWEVYPGSGGRDYFEPALAMTHVDGNPSTQLTYVDSEQRTVAGGTETLIRLRDEAYPVDVTLHYVAYEREDVMKVWSEISHQEKKPVALWRYASTLLYFSNASYYLTEFSGEWASEVRMTSQQLQFGKKIIDTKLGTRAGMIVSPYFELGLDGPVRENEGEVLLGTIGWTGNFRFTFEVDNVGDLRVIPAINPYASTYNLKPGETFTTPEFIFTLSHNGTGHASRNLHDWARRYQLKDGESDRMTLLNNWENTYFDFNEQKLGDLMKEARELGVDLFLLDDGWFGNKHPRSSDNAGLGDWEATSDKLPGGIPALVRMAKETGVKFGIWIEPEMVNPKSELFERHPDWVIHLPNRETYYFRSQLVLDLTNPEVQDYVFSIVDHIMTENPDVAYFKWDCNSPITNIYSPYLKKEQGRLYIDYVRGLYNVLGRVRAKYPDLPMMLCSGGGARCDYEALKYFTEFWCSDNTDPVERLYIQWGFSQFMPAKAMCAHVTSWNSRASIKFRTDVASMCKLGFDIGLKNLSADERTFCHTAVANYNRMKPAILEGRQYRLVSPYDGNHMALNYVSQDGAKVVLFAYDIHPRQAESLRPVRLQGLDPDARYTVTETNLMPGRKATLSADGKTFTGDFLMKVGLSVFTGGQMQSRVVELNRVD